VKWRELPGLQGMMKERNRKRTRRKKEEEDEDGRRRSIIIESTIGRRGKSSRKRINNLQKEVYKNRVKNT
jgi:hypothetical protein